MSWREQLQQASFAGVPFATRSVSGSGGRRVALHEYPNRDEPYAEDLGRKARRFSVEAFVLGADYMAARDRLIDALEAGAGTLIHPYRGQVRCTGRDYQVRETTREGGMATFTIEFIEAGQAEYPGESPATGEQVNARADALAEAATQDFARTFSVDGQPQYFVQAVQTETSRVLSEITQHATAIAGLVDDPAAMAAYLLDEVLGYPSATTALNAVRQFQRLFSAGDDAPSVPTTTTNRRRQARNVAAVHTLTRRAALVGAAKQAAQADYASRADATRTATTILDEIDDQQEATDPVNGDPIDDTVYQSLATLRATVAEDLRVRGARVPRLKRVQPRSTTPALALAHQIYGDATRETEIVARNGIHHPGFIVGGQPLEVLDA
ncbi:DNA circulation protein [Guyparkeria sp. SB14A]|uniref:DNA circularization protein n=1 Tax=Guyparkeria sp. SB14A TaxID=2571147 RepID=UPI0010AD7164|nr:DNA circularization N-terminal domain-containing protein [Guyparkeria sp. SB14A]TKA91804.1 DNA circulation protein [Guyparkeria sp. SB14A]